MATNEEYQALIDSLSGECERLHKENEKLKALSQEPTDAISREDALKLIYDFKERHTKDREKHPINYGTLLDLIRLIRELPSVTQKSGKWLLKRTFPTKLYDEHLNEYKCSECYREIRCTESQLVNYPYCHCGTKMESEVRNDTN